LRLDRSSLTPRVANEMESLTAFGMLSQPGDGLQDHAMFEELRDKIRRRGDRVARRALRDQLLEMTGFDRGFGDTGAGRADAKTMRFTFGVHSMRPEVGVRYSVGQANFRFHVDTSGELGVGLSRRGAGRAGVAASYEPGDDSFRIRARLGF
jgi:hypothetical protein